MQGKPTLKELVLKCRKNDRRAQAMLYEECFPVLMKICRRYRRQDEDARSMLNASFLKILLNLESYDVQQAFFPWASTIAVRVCIDELRKSMNYQSTMVFAEDDVEIINEVSNEVLQTISAEQVDLIMNKLPENQKLVFNMFEFEGYKHQEIADVLGITERTSKRLLQAARISLRAELIQQYDLKDVI